MRPEGGVGIKCGRRFCPEVVVIAGITGVRVEQLR